MLPTGAWAGVLLACSWPHPFLQWNLNIEVHSAPRLPLAIVTAKFLLSARNDVTTSYVVIDQSLVRAHSAKEPPPSIDALPGRYKTSYAPGNDLGRFS